MTEESKDQVLRLSKSLEDLVEPDIKEYVRKAITSAYELGAVDGALDQMRTYLKGFEKPKENLHEPI